MEELKCRFQRFWGFLFAVLLAFLGCIFTSKTASAVEITINSSPTGYKFLDTSFYCAYSRGQWTYSAGQACSLYGGAGLPSRSPIFGLKTASTVEVKEGYYYRFTVNVQSSAPDASMEAILWYPTTSNDFTFISFSQISDEMVYQNYISADTSGAYSKNYEITLRSKVTGDVQIQFGNGTNTLFWYPVNEVAPNQTSFIAFGEISEYKADDLAEALKNEREEEKSEYEDQADETEDTANDESSEAQSTATSLLSVAGQFIGVLTSAQPTNCNLNGNLIPHLPLGNLNLCQNSPPPAITALGSLILIAFVVPLAYHTVKRMLSLIGSFQS